MTINGHNVRDGVMKEEQNGSKQTRSAHQQHPGRVVQARRCISAIGRRRNTTLIVFQMRVTAKISLDFLDVKLSHCTSKTQQHAHMTHTYVPTHTVTQTWASIFLHSIYHRSNASYAGVYHEFVPCSRFVRINTS